MTSQGSKVVIAVSLLTLLSVAGLEGQVTVVNMIPNSLSNETTRDSEPSVAVNPSQPMEIAGSAFTPDPLASGNGPIFVSTDGGNTWALNVVLPGGNRTVDISLRFGTITDVLYAGILRQDNSNLNILRKPNFTAAGLMTTLINRANDDQPWVEAATRLRGAATDRVYVSHNNTALFPGQTASIDSSQDAATAAAPAGFASLVIAPRTNCNQDGPAVRTAVHPDGTVYAAYFRWTACAGAPFTSDVVVARDDNWGAGATPYTALTDPGDSLAGLRVATGFSIPWGSNLGTQRIGSQLAIAVDPTDSDVVYLAWADGTAANYTIHVRRSIDRGVTWSADLRAVLPATNPGLAVTTTGRVGFLYQQLTGTTPNQRWQTHVETSDDGFATAPTDFVLANVPDQNGTYGFSNPIGDYANLMAVGKTLYGAFAGNNTPVAANFPNNVTYQRNADWGTGQLRDTTNTANVGVSIDPFFFRVTDLDPGDDFYARDWTDNSTTGDTGLEPSTHPVFYATSDVWNRRGTLTGEPFANDQPANENAGNGAGNIGDNWAFARIRRNALPASGSQTVTAHFLVSKLGTGSNYEDAGSADPDLTFPGPDPTVTFTAGELGPKITPPYQWHLNAVSSSHLCLAVEIFTPSDPFVAPSLVGSTPGWPTTDLRVILDNNKAQRNMGLSTTPARGVGFVDSVYAIVHNAATFTRDIRLRYEVSPETHRRLGKAVLKPLGLRGQKLRQDGEIVLPKMRPGENRWLGLTYEVPQGGGGEILPVTFYEMVGETAVNGFALGARPAPLGEAIRGALELHRSVLTRLAAGFEVKEAKLGVEAVQRALLEKDLRLEAYGEFLRDQSRLLAEAVVRTWRTAEAGDPFSTVAAVKQLEQVLESDKSEAAVAAHLTLLHRLDAFLTLLQLRQGDVADILQMVHWQHDLYQRVESLARLDCADNLVSESERFVKAYRTRKAGNREYPELVKESLSCLSAGAEVAAEKGIDIKGRGNEIELSFDDLTRLQAAHRGLLLGLEELESW